jgi:hypothetical protein
VFFFFFILKIGVPDFHISFINIQILSLPMPSNFVISFRFLNDDVFQLSVLPFPRLAPRTVVTVYTLPTNPFKRE